jgi:hypothetical protein
MTHAEHCLLGRCPKTHSSDINNQKGGSYMEYETLDQWRDEFFRLQECRKEFETAELSNACNSGQGSFLKVRAFLEGVIERFGQERVKTVLGYTVRVLEWDGRFDRNVKAWAAKVKQFQQPPSSSGIPRDYHELVINSHPAILNEVIKLVIKHERSQEHPYVGEAAR